MTEKAIPTWQKLAAVAYVLAGALLVVVFSGRIGVDFWPPDSSRVGPNLVAAIVTVLVMTPLGVLLWPPTRRRLHRFMDAKLGGVHARLDELHEKHDHLIARVEELHAKHDVVHPPEQKAGPA